MIHGSNQTMRRTAKVLALVFGTIACVMTASAGAGLGGDDTKAILTLGIGFAAVSVGTAVLPYFIDAYWRAGSKITAGVLMGVLAAFGVAEYGAHVMYTVGHRSADAAKSIHQDAVYEGAQDGAKEAKAQFEIFTKRLADLTTANPWAASTTPDAIQASITSMEGDKLYARSKSCAKVTLADSRAFCDRYASAKAQLAVIGEMNKLPEQIDATRKVVESARTKLASSTQGDSGSLMQATLAANFATMDLRPSADAVQWSGRWIGAFVAFIFTIAAAVFMFIGYRDTAETEPEVKPEPARQYYSQAPAKPEIRTVNNHTFSILDPLFKITAPLRAA